MDKKKPKNQVQQNGDDEQPMITVDTLTHFITGSTARVMVVNDVVTTETDDEASEKKSSSSSSSPTSTDNDDDDDDDEILTSLQKLVSNTESVRKSVDALDAGLLQAVASLKGAISDVTGMIVQQDKRQRLEWAIDNHNMVRVNINVVNSQGFCWFDGDFDRDLAKEVLLAFRKGMSYLLSERWCFCHRCIGPAGDAMCPSEDCFELFRSHFASQIQTLTGIAPRIEPAADGFHIHYS